MRVSEIDLVVNNLKELFPLVAWDRLHDLDRAINYELHDGPKGYRYWTEIEPLEHYQWETLLQARDDLNAILDDLPTDIYYDADSGCVSLTDPQLDENNWDSETGDYLGHEEWYLVNTREILLNRETARFLQ